MDELKPTAQPEQDVKSSLEMDKCRRSANLSLKSERGSAEAKGVEHSVDDKHHVEGMSRHRVGHERRKSAGHSAHSEMCE